MQRAYALGVCLLLAAACAGEEPDLLPPDVSSYVGLRTFCEQWHAADGSVLLAERVAEECQATNNRLAPLRTKYRDRPDVLVQLAPPGS